MIRWLAGFLLICAMGHSAGLAGTCHYLALRWPPMYDSAAQCMYKTYKEILTPDDRK